MARKLQYQAISKTLFVPAATVAVFSAFSQPVPVRSIPAHQQTSVAFALPPAAAPTGVFSAFDGPRKRATLQHSFVFTPNAPAQPVAIFTQFSQPLPSRVPAPDDQAFNFFEPERPIVPPFTGFLQFSQPIKARFQACLLQSVFNFPYFIPQDTHDGVYVKRKRKHRKDPLDLEIESRAKLRAGIERAIYGDPVQIKYELPKTVIQRPAPDVVELAQAIIAARAAEKQAVLMKAKQDDEDDLDMILGEL